MKAGLVIYDSLERLSGGFLYDRMLVEHLRRQGDQVEVISLPWRAYAGSLADNFSSALLRSLAELQVDVLLQDELNHPSLFWLNRRLRKRAGLPTVAIVHHLRVSERRPAWQNALYKRVEAAFLRGVDGWLCNSRATLASVKKLAGESAAARLPSLVAPPGGDRLQLEISAEQIARRAWQPGPLRLLSLGNVIPRKGLHTLMAALRRLPRGDYTLEVIGNLEVAPAYTRRLRREVESSDLNPWVRFSGILAEDALRLKLTNAHALAMPSSYEGFGIVYLEGMGFGLPAIAGSGGGAGEIITHGVDGYLVAADDSWTLAHLLHELHADRQRLVTMSLAALQRYAAHPTWEQSMTRARGFLLGLVGRNA